MGVTANDVRAARERVARIAVRTPLVPSLPLGERSGTSAFLKLENVQPTGSFKIRGAANRMMLLAPGERARGVVTVSSGNHGRAVAYVARGIGAPAVVCLAATVPAHKVEAIRRLGAEVVIGGATYDEAEATALRLRGDRGLTFIEPFDDPRIIAGQGTTGLEILEDLPDLDAVVCPLGGGGLVGGIAVALKEAMPGVRVIGVSQDREPAMYRAIRAGHLVPVGEPPTLADAIVGGLGATNRYTLRICRDLLDDTVLVSEEEIGAAMVFLLREHRLVAEGGGAVGVAALMTGRARVGSRTAVVVSGGNADIPLLMRLAG